MKHRERMDLAKGIVKKVMKKYGNRILVGGVFGSTARNEDKEHSDLEMVFVTDSIEPEELFFAFKDIAVWCYFIKEKNVIEKINNVWYEWIFTTGHFLDMKVLCGQKNYINKFRNEVKNIPYKKFKDGAGETLLTVRDHLGKLKNAYEVKDTIVVFDKAKVITEQLNWSLALLNKEYYKTGGAKAFEQSKKWKILPKDYHKLVSKILLSRDINVVYKNIMKLWENSIELAKKYNIKSSQYKNIKSIKI